MQTRTPKDLKSKIKSQKSFFEFDKAKNLVLHSIKVYASKTYDDTVKLSQSDYGKVKSVKSGDVATFRKMFYALCRKDKLAIDSESEKLNLCKHARARQHCFNQIAKACNRADLIVDYTSKTKTTTKATSKAKPKANANKAKAKASAKK